jgi:purine-binding chemotaxis protein CheW
VAASEPSPRAEPDPARARALETLRARAEQIARPPPAVAADAATEVLVCRLGKEQYACELRLLQGVLSAPALTPVSCTPAFVAGALNVRGEVLTVLDLAVALGLTSTAATDAAAKIALAGVNGRRVGLLVDEVLRVEPLALENLDRALSGREFARGVAGSRTVVLNLEQLFAGERFTVCEDVT